MKKRIISLILAVVFVCLSFPFSILSVSAASLSGTCGADGDNLKWTFDSDSGTLTISGTGKMKDYENDGFAPSPRPWDDFEKDIITIVIEEGVTSLGSQAFYRASSVTSITIPNSVTSYFEGKIFASLSSLQHINIREDNDNYKIVDGVLFDKDMKRIIKYPAGAPGTSYTIPDGVVFIDSCAFESCKNLETVIIPDSVTDICQEAFALCDNLSEIHIPESVIDIYGGAFYMCTNLKKVNIPSRITTINQYTFAGCTLLESVVLPDNLNEILLRAFYFCESLHNVDLPESLTFIDRTAFGFCESFTDIVIPENVTYILESTFYACENLKSITLPEGIIAVEEGAFSRCISLAKVYYKGTESQRNKIFIDYENQNLTNAEWKYEYETPIVPGDATDDGRITISDVLKLRKYIAGMINEDSINTKTADINGDGRIALADVLCVRKYLAGLV